MATLVVSSPYSKGGLSDVRAYFNDNLKLAFFTFVPSTSYATNGDVIPAGSLPVAFKDYVATGPNGLIVPLNGVQGLYTIALDVPNSKLKFFTTTTMAEVANATNISTILGTTAITLVFLGR